MISVSGWKTVFLKQGRNKKEKDYLKFNSMQTKRHNDKYIHNIHDRMLNKLIL